ncbi:MAG: hypothetical protein EPO21_21925 [Chloroflexota bacterium]|nr:MAG: hypothetical protein EPO21_21925 [Chloroflexota bacterium]
MQVTYTVNGQSFMFEPQEEENLCDLAREVEEHVRAQHEELYENPYLSVIVADGVLNSLADDSADITLGELTRKA